MRIWEEIKRRRLSQVAVTYGVAAWAVVQVVTAVVRARFRGNI